MDESISSYQLIELFLSGLLKYIMYFILAIVFLLLFKLLYILITPNNDWKMIKDNQNTAASVALSGAVIGYSIAIASAAMNSVNIFDFMMWGAVAIIAQLLGFYLVRLLMLPKLASRIEQGEMSSAIVVGSVAISVGLLNAACMTF